MSGKTISTLEGLIQILRETVSQRRFVHSLGVAETTEMLLQHYGCSVHEKSWNGFSAGSFCGIAHDMARELPEPDLVQYCRENSIPLTREELESPVLAHGKVSAHMVRAYCPGYPESWQRAIEVHTTGAHGMDDLALALFVADYLEPSRPFLTQDQRKGYVSQPDLPSCAYAVLSDMIAHWREKGYHDASGSSLALLRELEEKRRI